MPKTAKQLFDKWFCFSFNLVLISGFKGTVRTHRFAKSSTLFYLGLSHLRIWDFEIIIRKVIDSVYVVISV
jgi:hypothetical protein